MKILSPKASEKVLQGNVIEYDEDNVHEYVDKPIANLCKEANKQLLITELLKPILQNPDKHCTDTDMDQEVKLDPKAMKNELAEDEPHPEFRDQMWRQ